MFIFLNNKINDNIELQLGKCHLKFDKRYVVLTAKNGPPLKPLLGLKLIIYD